LIKKPLQALIPGISVLPAGKGRQITWIPVFPSVNIFFSEITFFQNNVFILHDNLLSGMKNLFLFSFVLLFSFQAFAQLLSWTPDLAKESSNPFTITMDANYGNKGLLNHSTSYVYVHILLKCNRSIAIQ
jgi:hypothetical protein